MNTPENAEKLTEQAFAALKIGDLKTAQSIASQLKEMRFSSHFEIQALVYLREKKTKQAIKILREGVQKAPSVWGLWQLLGNSLSDESKFDEALQCYETALKLDLDKQSITSLQFNRATVMNRLRHYDSALKVLDEMEETSTSSALHFRCWGLRLQLLCSMANCRAVTILAEELEGQLLGTDCTDEESVEAVWQQGAEALYDCAQNEAAHRWAKQCLEADRTNSVALQIYRQTKTDVSLAEQYFRVVFQGTWPGDSAEEDEQGFFVTYSAIARDAAEAEQLAREIEALRWDVSIQLEDCELLGDCKPTAVGVYQVSGYMIFPMNSEEDDD